MTKKYRTLEEAYEDDTLTVNDLSDMFSEETGLSWDNLQAGRKAYREQRGIPPIKRGPKSQREDTQPRPVEDLVRELKQGESSQPIEIVITHRFDQKQIEFLESIIINLLNK